MSFFHASERLYAGAEQLRRFLMSDFPDERLPDHRSRLEYLAAPDHDVVDSLGSMLLLMAPPDLSC